MQSALNNRPAYGVTGIPLAKGGTPDWMLWVEDDSTPPADAFALLRQHADPVERPVMHGISFDRVLPHDPSIWRVQPGDSRRIEPIADWQDNTLYRIAHSGTCVVLFHSSVWGKLQRPWFRMQPFEPGCQGMIPCISLSQRMREADVPIWAFTGCVAGHMAEPVEINAQISRALAGSQPRPDEADGRVGDQVALTKRKLANDEIGDFGRAVEIFEGLLADCWNLGEYVVCLGARRGEEVQALLNLGLRAQGYDLVPAPPLVLQGNFHHLPVTDESADGVFCNSVDHSDEPQRLAAEIGRILRPGGAAVLHLSIGVESPEMVCCMKSSAEFATFFPNYEVLKNEPMSEYGGGMNWLLVLRKPA